ncbi:glutamate racemase [Aliikangiella marina]|uniref:Glutamate racemase n=1 Tax=Aliikangiella marina TaxID=1712262 RepID=A0A545TA36_9GAMM|nr:glutamate racemase [Aliikangiella marina]TQV74079.1 glutamate racemase [Aliikangiella marina]
MIYNLQRLIRAKKCFVEVIIRNPRAIGIFDSGAGGLSVLKAVNQVMPSENIIYVADTLHSPYGTRSQGFIESRVLEIAEFLVKQNVKAIVVACNTATAAAINHIRNLYPIPIIGLEPAIKPALEMTKVKTIGVLATQATLESEKYLNLKSQLQGDNQIIEKASSYFVELVEAAKSIDKQEEARIADELAGFIGQVDCLVLGCTHYPFLTTTIRKIVGEKVKIFESALPVANELARRIKDQQNASGSGEIQYYSSDPELAKITFNNLLEQEVAVSLFDGNAKS